MTEATKNVSYGPIVVLGLGMALGPLTALSFGTRYAGEETWARANAGLENATPAATLAQYESGDALAAIASGRTIVDVLGGSGVFDELREGIVKAGLDQVLSSQGQYTVFAPSDEAFAKLTQEQRAALSNDPQAMAQLLANHVVPGRYTATHLMREGEAQALNGKAIKLGPSSDLGGRIAAADAEVVQSNLFAANGVVHVIDRVIQ